MTLMPSTTRRRFLQVGAAVGTAAALASAAPTRAGAAPGPPAISGLKVVAVQKVRDRLFDYEFITSALGVGEAHARVLLPKGYDDDSDHSYPVLFLLHGASFEPGHRSWIDWTELQRTEEFTADLPVIVVMPFGGNVGFYTDWHNQGRGGRPKWETFHIGQLLPWVDTTFRTVPTRAGRSIAGVSMGGFGAMSYAARHPDLFQTAASFSGVVSMSTLLLSSPTTVPAALFTELSAAEPFGNPITYPIGAMAHDPVALAENLRSVDLSLSTGDGRLGPLDVGQFAPGASKGPDPLGFGFEVLAHRCNLHLHAKLDALAIGHRFDDYGPGTHTIPYFDRSLDQSLDGIMAGFAAPAGPPGQVTYTSGEASYSVFGWQVTLFRRAQGFSRIADADATGFQLRGSGRATVATPGFYDPGSRHDVAVGGSDISVVADDFGRLWIEVDLGPSSPVPQFSPGATAAQVTRTVRVD